DCLEFRRSVNETDKEPDRASFAEYSTLMPARSSPTRSMTIQARPTNRNDNGSDTSRSVEEAEQLGCRHLMKTSITIAKERYSSRANAQIRGTRRDLYREKGDLDRQRICLAHQK